MNRNFKYFIVFTSAPGILPEQNDWYRIQPWKANEIKAYKNGKSLLPLSSTPGGDKHMRPLSLLLEI